MPRAATVLCCYRTGSALDLPISLRRATPDEAVVASRWPSHRDVMAHQMAESCHPSGTLGEWWRRRGFSFADCSMPRSARPGSAPPPLSAPRSRTAVDVVGREARTEGSLERDNLGVRRFGQGEQDASVAANERVVTGVSCASSASSYHHAKLAIGPSLSGHRSSVQL